MATAGAEMVRCLSVDSNLQAGKCRPASGAQNSGTEGKSILFDP